jgi:coenzyme F420-reducing hydrogenase delta subunit
MCSGRVDPVLIMESFSSGADGVMVGACLKGECHYSIGNLQAEGKVEVTRRVLSRIGLDPERLVLRMMSSAQGGRFVEYVTGFQEAVAELGPLGSSEGVTGAELELRLTAALNAVSDKKLRWVEGKWLEFQQDGNVYGEVFTLHELGRMYEEVVLDECALQEIRLRLEGRPQTAPALSGEMRIPAYKVLRHLADLRRMGFVVLGASASGEPLWSAAVTRERPRVSGDDLGQAAAGSVRGQN